MNMFPIQCFQSVHIDVFVGTRNCYFITCYEKSVCFNFMIILDSQKFLLLHVYLTSESKTLSLLAVKYTHSFFIAESVCKNKILQQFRVTSAEGAGGRGNQLLSFKQVKTRRA